MVNLLAPICDYLLLEKTFVCNVENIASRSIKERNEGNKCSFDFQIKTIKEELKQLINRV